MEPVRIWLNRNYATTVHVLDMLRHNGDGVPVELYGSHTDLSSPMLTGCDYRLREPSVTEPNFVDSMLELCVRHDIDVLLPVAGQSLIAHRSDEFFAAGTALISPKADVIDVLADKASTYLAMGGSELVPPWRVIRSVEEFDAAVEEFDPLWTRQHALILKPTLGVGAEGVRFLMRSGPDLGTLLGPVGPLVNVAVVRDALVRASHIPPLMVMPYLSGPETSVDILADRGRTLAAVPRTKTGRQRVIGGDPALPGLAAELVEHFDLDGLVNVQFRSWQGRPALLEINSRPSGGLYQTVLAGVNLPWAAVQVALGIDPGPLRPRLGAEYVTVSSTIPLTGAQTRVDFSLVAPGEPVAVAGPKPLVALTPAD